MLKMAMLLSALLTLALLPTLPEATIQEFPTLLDFKSSYNRPDLAVFQFGNYHTNEIRVDSADKSKPPKSLFIVTPTSPGTYPVLMFHQGTALSNEFYSDLFHHISSHGYIVVAPQYYWMMMIPPGCKEVIDSANVANWLPSGLNKVLSQQQPGVQGDVKQIAVSGHSRGGHMAFGLALGKCKINPLNVNIKALIAVDPVGGQSNSSKIDPLILTYKPNSFNLDIPVSIIGTGLGSSNWPFMPPCAPNGVNHKEYFNECKAPCGHFVTKNYGHMDMLNPSVGFFGGIMCKCNFGDKTPMRRTVGGITVAFLKASLKGETDDYRQIYENPSKAPVKLEDVDVKTEIKLYAHV